MEKYIAQQDMPLGVFKGNTVEVDDKGICRNAKGVVLPYKPADEKLFFLPMPYVAEYPIGARLCVPVTKDYDTHGGGTKTLSAHESTSVGNVIKKGGRLFYVLAHHTQTYCFVVPVKEVVQYEEYYFISSAGKVHNTRLGKDADADTFRKLMKNYFGTKPEAIAMLEARILVAQPVIELEELSSRYTDIEELLPHALQVV